MKNFLMKTVTALGFIAALALVGIAQQTSVQTTPASPVPPVKEERHKGHHGEHRMREMFESLNLSDAQKQQIGAIMSKHQTEMQAQRQEAHSLMKQQRHGATLTSEQQARLQTLHEQLKANEKQTHQELVAMLTPDQRTQLKAKMQEMRMHKKGNGAFGENQQPNR